MPSPKACLQLHVFCAWVLGCALRFPFANLCEFPFLVNAVLGLGPLLTVCGRGFVLALSPLTSPSMDVSSRLHPPCRSAMWIEVLPPSILALIKWCTGLLVRYILDFGVWPAGAKILFLEVELLGTWPCHPHATSAMLHKVTCSIVSRSVQPLQPKCHKG